MLHFRETVRGWFIVGLFLLRVPKNNKIMAMCVPGYKAINKYRCDTYDYKDEWLDKHISFKRRHIAAAAAQGFTTRFVWFTRKHREGWWPFFRRSGGWGFQSTLIKLLYESYKIEMSGVVWGGKTPRFRDDYDLAKFTADFKEHNIKPRGCPLCFLKKSTYLETDGLNKAVDAQIVWDIAPPPEAPEEQQGVSEMSAV